MIRIFLLTLLVLWAVLVTGWRSMLSRNSITSKQIRQTSTSLQMALSAASSVLKKGKRKFIDSLYKEMEEQGESHIITHFLRTGQRPERISKPIDFYAMARYLGVFAVLPEFNRKVKTNFIFGLPPPGIMGGVYRDAGARGIIVSVDQRTGGTTTEEFAEFAIEQASAREFIPGPLPVVWNDIILDKVQIHQAAALGASAVTIQEELVDNITEILTLCKRYKMEPIFMIKNLEEFQSGNDKKVRCFIAHQLEEEGFKALRSQLPSKKDRPDLFFVAKFRPSEDYSLYYEIDLAWGVRGFGYDGVWPSPDGLYGSEMSDVYSGIIAMKAKASRRFLSPRQFLSERKKEGVTEYLGDILY